MTLELTEEITFSLPFSPMPLTLCETLSCFLWVPFPGLSHNVCVKVTVPGLSHNVCVKVAISSKAVKMYTSVIEFLRLIEVT